MAVMSNPEYILTIERNKKIDPATGNITDINKIYRRDGYATQTAAIAALQTYLTDNSSSMATDEFYSISLKKVGGV